jgi:hypothetical protein
MKPQNSPISTRKTNTTRLIWNDRCQVDKLNYFYFFLHFFNDTFQVQATSTMNQSDNVLGWYRKLVAQKHDSWYYLTAWV